MTAAKKQCKKKQEKMNKDEENQQINLQSHESVLLPGLPNHLAHLCLSNLQPALLYSVCMPWRRLVYSPHFPPFFSLYALLRQAPSMASSLKDQCLSHSVGFFCFDPIASKWRSLPSPPSEPPLCLLSQHPSYISRILPIQSLTTSGRLVLIAANTHKFLPALNHPLVFDPLSSKWNSGPPFPTPRRWCATGTMHGAVYVASGMGARYHCDVARSVERWDMLEKETNWNWEKKAPLRDGRFSRDAIEALGHRDKLCMVNIKGRGAKEGAIYDVQKNHWEEMPQGMVGGWNGPATMDDDVMYVVDEKKGSLSKYDAENDCWEEVIEPTEYLKGAEHISAGRGKVCAVSADGKKIIVVDILTRPTKIWMLDPPYGMEVIAVHILPRMSLPEY